MTVYKPKASPYYHYDFVVDGVRYQRSTKCTTKAKAETVERRAREEVALGALRRPSITLDEACGLYQDKVETSPSWPTIRYMLEALVTGLGAHARLSDLGNLELRRYFKMRLEGHAPASANREIDNARAVWRLAEASGFEIGQMPNWRTLKFKVGKRPPRELSRDEEQRLFANIRPDIRDAVDFLLKSGWRLSEVLNLRWSDCDLSAMSAQTKIKGGDTVRRPLTNSMVNILERQPRIGPYVFSYECQRTNGTRRKGTRYPLTVTAFRRPWHSALVAAKVDNFRAHDLRHTRGTRIVRSTGSLAAAKEALKHTSINTTLRYAHVLDEDVRKALDDSESRNSPEANQTKVAKS